MEVYRVRSLIGWYTEHYCDLEETAKDVANKMAIHYNADFVVEKVIIKENVFEKYHVNKVNPADVGVMISYTNEVPELEVILLHTIKALFVPKKPYKPYKEEWTTLHENDKPSEFDYIKGKWVPNSHYKGKTKPKNEELSKGVYQPSKYEISLEFVGLKHDTITQKLLKKMYKKLAKKHHPDKGGSAVKFIQLTEAYDFIMKTHKWN